MGNYLYTYSIEYINKIVKDNNCLVTATTETFLMCKGSPSNSTGLRDELKRNGIEFELGRLPTELGSNSITIFGHRRIKKGVAFAGLAALIALAIIVVARM